MNLAEKIMMLRKQKGWSQEELAMKLNVSRQSVSKWESTSSVPDLSKIIKLSEIFDVSTDFLLKDEITLEEGVEETPAVIPARSDSEKETEAVRSVTLEEAESFLEVTARTSVHIALGVALCIMSPIILIILGGFAEYRIIPMSEDMAGVIGTSILLIMIGIAVAIFIMKGMKLDEYEHLEKECFVLEEGIYEIVEQKKREFAGTFRVCIAVGVVLCIFGVIPVLIAAVFQNREAVMVCCIGILLFMIACGVYLFVWSGMINGSYEKLLQEGEYTSKNKRFNKDMEVPSGIYWGLVTTIYLFISFSKMNWHISWIIWPCAGVFYGVFCAIIKMFYGAFCGMIKMILGKK